MTGSVNMVKYSKEELKKRKKKMKTLERKRTRPTGRIAIRQMEKDCMLIYRLCSGRSPIEFFAENDHLCKRFFSISITKINADSILEEKEIYEFACERKDALSLFSLLVRNTVTPCTLVDIVEDFRLDRNIC